MLKEPTEGGTKEERGCGVVYLAEPEEPVRRTVPLKGIKRGMDTENVVARFQAERKALALIDPPNIAKVLDAGSTETGRPYFVMKLVRGHRQIGARCFGIPRRCSPPDVAWNYCPSKRQCLRLLTRQSMVGRLHSGWKSPHLGPAANGPWAPASASVFMQHGRLHLAVPRDGTARFFRSQ